MQIDAISRSAEKYPIDGESLFNRVQKLKHYEVRQNLFDDSPLYEVFKCQDVLDEILASERLDVAPVVHARWIRRANTLTQDPYKYGKPIYECSVCGRCEEYEPPYCHCGARMDGEADG